MPSTSRIFCVKVCMDRVISPGVLWVISSPRKSWVYQTYTVSIFSFLFVDVRLPEVRRISMRRPHIEVDSIRILCIGNGKGRGRWDTCLDLSVVRPVQ